MHIHYFHNPWCLKVMNEKIQTINSIELTNTRTQLKLQNNIYIKIAEKPEVLDHLAELTTILTGMVCDYKKFWESNDSLTLP